MIRLKSCWKITLCQNLNLTSKNNLNFAYLLSKKYSASVKEGNLSYSSGKSDFFKNMVGLSIPDSLKKMALQKPNEICYKFCLSQTALTYMEVQQRVNEFAQNLISLGFNKGDRLGKFKSLFKNG